MDTVRVKIVLFLTIFAVVSLIVTACGGSSGGRDSRLVGTWIVDRIVGDTDTDADDSTLIYNDDGTAQIRAEGDSFSGTWDTDDDTILTTLPSLGVTLSSGYSLSNNNNILTTTTDLGNGVIVTELYYRLTNNYPSELLGTWTPVSKTVFGESVSIAEEPQLILQDGGTGSVSWSVTEDRLLIMNADTLAGLAYEYSITTADGSTRLTIREDDDAGATVITYELQ